jgi:ketosteroid isomerase-like protein
MFRKFLILAVVALVPSLAAAQSDTAANTKQIEAMERGLNAAIQKGDLNAFKANIAEDAVSMDGNGPMPIAEFLKMFSQFKVASFSIDQAKVTFLNDTAAVITYRWTGKGTMMGQAIPSPTWASTTWLKRAGKWVAVFHQETIATPPPPPAKK